MGDEAIVAVQNPITIHEYSEPEPDWVVAKFREDFYTKDHPTPHDVLLVVEVADTNLEYDLKAKVPLYAVASILEVCLVNLNSNTLTLFQQPEGIGYREQVSLTAKDIVQVPGFEGATLVLDQIGL